MYAAILKKKNIKIPTFVRTSEIIDLSRSDKMKIRYFVLQIILQNPSIFLNISVLVPNAPVFKI